MDPNSPCMTEPAHTTVRFRIAGQARNADACQPHFERHSQLPGLCLPSTTLGDPRRVAPSLQPAHPPPPHRDGCFDAGLPSQRRTSAERCRSTRTGFSGVCDHGRRRCEYRSTDAPVCRTVGLTPVRHSFADCRRADEPERTSLSFPASGSRGMRHCPGRADHIPSSVAARPESAATYCPVSRLGVKTDRAPLSSPRAVPPQAGASS